MRMSPDCIFWAIDCAVDSVGAPAGTMSQAMRGEPSLEQKSSSEEDGTAPSEEMPLTAAGLRSVTTTSWPPRIRRRAMLAPIRPRPTIPRRMYSPPPCLTNESTQSFTNSFRQRRQTGVHIAAQMHTQGAPASVGEDLEISAGLCGFHHSEGVFLSRDWYIVGIVTRDLQKYAAIGAAFVGLSG